MLVGIFGVLKAGGAYLPLDPTYPAGRLTYMIEDARPILILTQEALRQRLPEAIETLCLDKDWPSIGGASQANPVPRATPGNLAYVIYTSGSTGRPKGVAVSHGGIPNLAVAQQAGFGVGAASRVLQFSAWTFDAAVSEIAMVVSSGACLVLPCLDERSGDALIQLLIRERITHATLPPAVLSTLVPSPELALQCLVVAGEACPTELASVWGADRRMINAYGPTETTVCATISEPLRAGEAPPIGRPIWNARIYLLDDHMLPVPVGVAGELYIGGAGLARGYLGRPDLTAERFVPDPFGGAGERLYRTGDLARYRPDGNIDYLGRIDHQVKIRGFRIELGEIEAALSRIPGVREAVVLAREDSPGDKRLVAYVAGSNGAEPAAAALRAALQRELPDYMVPAAFVVLDALPLTSNGKVDRKALPAPDIGAQVAPQYVAPRTPAEETLCRIWAEVLGIERAGIEDNFFELGGHSLLAVTLIERMRRQGLPTNVRALFANPTPAGLAAVIGSGGEVAVPPNLIPPGCAAITPEMLPLAELSQADIDRIVGTVPGGASNVQDIYPLAPLQEGILFHHLLAAKGDPYLLQTLMAFDTRERFEDFLGALQAAISRHDILRTAVIWEGLPEPMQVVWREARLTVEEVALDSAAGDVGEQLRARFDPRQYRLDVQRVPMMRGFTNYDAAKKRWLLLLLTHHLTWDHMTLEILVEEAQAYLLRQSAQITPPLPFRNFVAQARLGVSQAEHEAFFKAMLGDVAEPTAPFGLLDAQGDGSGIAESSLDLDAVLARRLRARARALGVSTASLFHEAFAQVLARVSGRSDVVFGTVLFGRMHGGAGADRGVGLYINTLPVRVRLGAENVVDGVRRMHGTLTALLRHEHASLALAQRCSAVQAPAPLFSALLNYRHSVEAQASEEAVLAWAGMKTLHVEDRTSYPLNFCIDDLGEGFQLTAQTLSPVAPDRVCAFIRVALEGLVEALETAPQTLVRTLDVLPDAERRQLLVEWNSTAAQYPQDRLPHVLFEEQVARAPASLAVCDEWRQLSYEHLNGQANQLARELRARGVGLGDLVAVCVERSVDMVAALLAVLKAGAAYVPLDPNYPPQRLDEMLRDVAPRAVLTQQLSRASFLGYAGELIVLDKIWTRIAEREPDNLSVSGLTLQNLAYLIFTSGSTGRPKAAGVYHRGLTNLAHWYVGALGLSAADRVLVTTSYSFDLTQKNLLAGLLKGGSVHLAPEPFDPAVLTTAVARHGITVLNLTPSAFAPIADADAGATLASLRYVVLGGEPINAAQITQLLLRYPRLKVVNSYGPTECADVCAFHLLKSEDLSPPAIIPIGRPIPNARLYILDDLGQPVPLGVQGELYVAGVGVGVGYLNRPELTAERFAPNSFANAGERLYRTGDLARYRSDGAVEFLGRIDHQVKIRGFRIELGEIEARLSALPEVREAVVLAREDIPGNKRLVAYVVPTADSCSIFPKGEYADMLQERLSAWQAVFDQTNPEQTQVSDFNTSGWISSFTGAPIPAEEMQEWVHATVSSIKALKPRKVLDIGCGTGLLLLRIASECERYVGTDMSSAVLKNLRTHLQSGQSEDLRHVELLKRFADDYSGLDTPQFDTIILNSVTQYFPDAAYLRRVLEGALRVLEPGGRIFVGDVRNLALRQAFYLAVEMATAAPTCSCEEINQRVNKRMVEEEELLIDPALFAQLNQDYPQLGDVELLIKRGRAFNEMTQFRYDAVLHLNPANKATPAHPTVLLWGRDVLGLKEVRDFLIENSPAQLTIRNVPNARTADSILALSYLAEAERTSTLQQLRSKLTVPPSVASIDPEDVWEIGAGLPYEFRLHLSRGSRDGSFDIVCRPAGHEATDRMAFQNRTASVASVMSITNEPIADQKNETWSAFANTPLKTTVIRHFVLNLTTHLRDVLPDYMVPSAFVVMEALVLTPNGKVDRKALPSPDLGAQLAHQYVAPRTPAEETLCRIWAEVLGIERVGIEDNFFELGGHSLLAVTLIERMRRQGLASDVRALFAHPTPAGLAAAVGRGDVVAVPPNLIPEGCEAITPEMLPW